MIQPVASILVATLCMSGKVTVMDGTDITSALDTGITSALDTVR
jgi:hypothetical protein